MWASKLTVKKYTFALSVQNVNRMPKLSSKFIIKTLKDCKEL